MLHNSLLITFIVYLWRKSQKNSHKGIIQELLVAMKENVNEPSTYTCLQKIVFLKGSQYVYVMKVIDNNCVEYFQVLLMTPTHPYQTCTKKYNT
jgi:protein gp37